MYNLNRTRTGNLPLYFFFILLLHACGSETPELSLLPSGSTILAFGDSLTYGTGARSRESYPAILEVLTGYKIINSGNPGELSERGLKRFRDTLDKSNPQLIILCHGGNDILKRKDLNQAKQNIMSMINMANERNIPVVLLGVPNFGIFLNSAPFYNEIAEETGVIYMPDLIPDILSDAELKSDHVHPNARGYRVMAEKIKMKLAEAGAIEI